MVNIAKVEQLKAQLCSGKCQANLSVGCATPFFMIFFVCHIHCLISDFQNRVNRGISMKQATAHNLFKTTLHHNCEVYGQFYFATQQLCITEECLPRCVISRLEVQVEFGALA